MLQWLSELTSGLGLPSPAMMVAILLPVLGFVLLAAGARVLYGRWSDRAALVPRRIARSSIGKSLDELAQIVQSYYKSQGYDVLHDNAPGESAVELVVLKDSQRTLIHCLNVAEPPEPEIVEQLAAARDRLQAQRAVLIAPAGFTSNTRRRAVSLGVELRDKTQIELMRRMAERRAA
jgi:hypothetical protein